MHHFSFGSKRPSRWSSAARRRFGQRFLKMESLERRELMAIDLNGGVVGAATGPLDVSADLRLSFTEPVARGTGNILLLKSGGELIETFNAATSSALSLSGNTLTIDPFWNLDGDSDYYLAIDSGALTDTSSNPFAGVNSATTLAFRTGVETAGALGAAWLRDLFPGTSSESIGNHSALFIRATFPDLHRAPSSLEDARAAMDDVAEFFAENSRGRISLTTTYTPVVTLDFAHQWHTAYDSELDGLSLIQTAARREALKLGFDSSQFNVTLVRVDAALRSGASWGGGDSVWLAWGGGGVAAHEIGHTLGLGHSNSITWDGQTNEYGNQVDNMGSGDTGPNHFIGPKKATVGWIDNDDTLVNPGPGIYRIYAAEQANQVKNRHYGLSQVIPATQISSTNPTIRLEYRPAQGGAFEDALLLFQNDNVLKYAAGGAIDLNATHGKTYKLPGSEMYLTVLAKGDGYLDVAYQQGPFPGNTAPSAAFTATASSVKRFDSVTFNANAVDADGDQLIYRWTFSDGVVGVGRTFTRVFQQSTSTNVTVTLDVGDLRGGVATRTGTVAAGAANTTGSLSVGTISPPMFSKPSVSVLATDAFAAEGGDTGAFTISRVGTATNSDLVVNLAWSGTGQADFSSLPNSVTIPAGQTSATIIVTPTDDTAIEGLEQLTVTLAANSAYNISGQNGAATAQLDDNDTPVVTVTASDAMASESGRDAGVFRLERTGATAQPLTVYYGLSGTAFNGADYGRLDGQVVIPAGQSFATVTVMPLVDAVGDPDETVTLTVATFNDVYSVGSASQSTVTIADASPLPMVSVVGTAGESIVAEGGIAKLIFTSHGGDGTPVVVSYTISGTAASGSDFPARSDRDRTALGGTGGTQTATLSIPITADGAAEADESLIVTLASAPTYMLGLDNQAQITLLEPVNEANGGDRVRVSRFAAGPAEASSAPANFYVYRDSTNTSRQALTVTYSLTGTATPGTDYTGEVRSRAGAVLSTFTPAASNTVTIPANADGVVVRLTPVDDAIAEGTESIRFRIQSVTGGAVVGINATARYDLPDNDASATLVGFASLASLWGEEKNPGDNVRSISVTLSQAAPAGGVQVSYRADGGSALGYGIDWVFVDSGGAEIAAMNGVLSFAAGETTKTIRVRVQNDRIVESQEMFAITLENPLNASLQSAANRHVVTLFDVIPSGLVFEERWAGGAVFTNNSWATSPVSYQGYLTGFTSGQNVDNDFSRRLTGFVTAPATGQYTFYASGDDGVRLYVGTSEAASSKVLVASVPTSGWTGFQEWNKYPAQKSTAITLQAGQRYYVEVQHQEGGGGDHVSIGWTGPGISSITPISTASAIATRDNRYVRFLAATSSVTEGQPLSQPILVTLDRANDNASVTVGVEVVAVSTTAGGSDYSLGATSLTFAPGEVSKPIDISALADSVNEPAERVVLRLVSSNGARIIGPATHALTIVDANSPQFGPFRGFTARGDAVGSVVGQMAANIATGRTAQTWEILAGNPRVEGSPTAAFAIDGEGRITLANPDALPLSSVQLDLTVRLTDNLGSSTLALAPVIVNGGRIQEERWSSEAIYNAGKWGSAPDFSANLSSFDAPRDVAEHYSRRITGMIVPQTTGDYSFWIAARDAGRLTIAPFDSPTSETEIARSNDANYQAWDAADIQQSGPQSLIAGTRYILRAYQRESYWDDHLSVAWSGPNFDRQVIPTSAMIGSFSQFRVGPGNASEATPASVPTYSLSATAITDSGLAASIDAGGFTRDNTLGLSGTAMPGAKVSVYAGPTFIGQGMAASDGTWSLTTRALDDGDYVFRAEVIDSVGNAAVTTTRAFSVRSAISVSPLQLVSTAIGGSATAANTQAVGNILAVRSVDQGLVTYEMLSDVPFTEQRWSGSTAFNTNTWTGTPDYSGTLGSLTTAQNVGDNYSRRITGWITAPATGSYNFYVAGDDDVKLYVSSDDTAANKGSVIASIPSGGWTGFQQWNRYSSQKSAAVSLQAGQRYYVEVQQLEGYGGDHVSVAWTGPGISAITPISILANLLSANVSTGAVQLVSRGVSSATEAAGVPVVHGGTSANGRYIVFGASQPAAFGTGGTAFTDANALSNGLYSDLFVYDRTTQAVRLATAGSTAASTRSRQAEFVGITADNRYAIYTTDYVENIGGFSAPGKPVASTWTLVDGGYPTPSGKAKTTTLRVADIDPTTLSFQLSGGFINNDGQTANVSVVTIKRPSAGVLSFWVEGSVENKAVKLELEDTSSGILVKATAAKYGAGTGADWDSSGTLGTVATSLTANGYGVSLLQATGANLTPAMREEGAIAARDVIAFDLVTGLQSLLSHSAAASNLESQAGDVRNVTLSADGRYVLFTAADATKFGNGGTAFADSAPMSTDLFAADVQTGQIRLLSRSGGSATASAGVVPTLLGTTSDGWAVFSVNDASALGFTDGAASTADLIAVNLADGALKLVSRASGGTASSSAGVAVTFERIVGNHVYFAANNATSFGFTSDADTGRADLFRFAPSTGSMELLSHSTTNANAAFAGSYRTGSLTVSPNGRFVAFAMNMQGSSGGFTVNVNGDALFLADLQTGAIRLVNSSNHEGTTLSYAAWAGVQDFARFFTPDSRLFVWSSSYGGYFASDRTGAAFGWDSQYGSDAYAVDLSSGVSSAGIAQTNRLLNHAPASPTVAAAGNVTLVGVSLDSRLAFFLAADASKFGNRGSAFEDSAPSVNDVFAVDLATRAIALVSGSRGVSFGQTATFLGVGEGGTALVSLGNVAGLGSVAGTLTDPNANGTDLLSIRLNLLDLVNADDSADTGTANDNFTKKSDFTLTSLGVPGRSLQLLDNGVLVATQTPDASGLVTWALTNVANGVHTFTLRDTAELVPFRLASVEGSPSLTVTVDVNNRAPTNIGLSRSLIAENAGANAVVGSLSTTDPDAGNTFAYSLVSGTGSTDNAAFNISGNQLRANASLSLATQSSYSVRIRTSDQDGMTFEKSFMITVTVANRAPTDLSISASSLVENAGVNAVVGTLSSTDPDEANEFTYSLVAGAGDTDNSLFHIAGTQLRATASLDFETKSSYSVRVRTTDDGGLAFDKTFTITATNANEPPMSVSLLNNSVAENAGANAGVGTLSSTDPDAGDTFTYTLVAGTGSADNASFNIFASQLRAAADLDFENKSIYSIRVRVADANGLSREEAFTISATNVNESPTNVALSQATIMEQAGVNAVVGDLSTIDPDAGDTFTYSLVAGTGSTDNSSFNISGGQLRANASFSLATQSGYSVRVRTTDQGGLTFEKAFAITVTLANLAPTDIALSGTTIAENAGADVAVGTLSTTDPDVGNSFTYSLVSGTGDTDNSLFDIAGTQFRATASLDFETKSSFSVRVRTTDQGGLSFEKTFTITATNVNEPPTDIALSKTTIVENAGANAVVGSLSTMDPDADNTFTYSLVEGTGSTDNAAFNISENQLRATSSLSVVTKSSYLVRVRATDQDGLSFEKAFTITAMPANRAPTNLVLSSTTISENSAANTVVGDLSSVDPDIANTFNYSLVSGEGSTDNAAFNIVRSRLRANSAFNFESKGNYAIRLRTTDQDGLFFEKMFTVSVTNVNEAPTDVTLAPNSIAENAGANGVVGTLTAIDPDPANTFTFFTFTLVAGIGDTDNGSFNIQGNKLRATNSLDFETKSSYSVRVRAEDHGGLSFDKTLTISVTNVNDAPTNLVLSNNTIAENAGANALVGNFAATDPDAGSQFTYKLVTGEGSTDNRLFKLAGNQLRAANSLNFEAKSGFTIRVAATDLGGLAFVKSFTITATNVNETPTNLTLSKLAVAENAGADAVVGQFATTDPDMADTFTYTLVAGTGSTDNAVFNILGNQLRAAASLDFETKSSYLVRVRTTDAGGLFVEKSFKIQVVNVNDAPTNILLSSTQIAENAGANAVVGTFTGTDQDKSSTFTFTLVAGTGDTDNAAFNISRNQLRATQSLNFEIQNSYSVRVRVTDQVGGQFEKAFTISVSNVNETPTAITLSNSTITENAGDNAVVGTLSTTDPDVGGSFTYSLVTGAGDSGNRDFNISGNQLRATKSLNAAVKSSYSVRVQVADQGGLKFVRTFTITVTTGASAGAGGPNRLAASSTAASPSTGHDPGEGELSWEAYESRRACDAIFAAWDE
ncbi:MAG: hypothetical protein RLY70_1998 [Planctomycetota bacterium]